MGGGKTDRSLQGVVNPLKASSYVPPFGGKTCYVLVAEFQVHLLHYKWTAWADSKCLLCYKTKKP